MNKLFILIGWFLLLGSQLSYAEATTIVCQPPQGTRVDYFAHNPINLNTNTFIMGKDGVSGMQPKIILNGDAQTVSFFIGDAASAESTTTKSGNMKVISYGADQISFTGLVHNAPILGSYYPKLNILIYSQQSVWPGPDYEGARAVIFYSKCK